MYLSVLLPNTFTKTLDRRTEKTCQNVGKNKKKAEAILYWPIFLSFPCIQYCLSVLLMEDAVRFLLWWTVGFASPSLSAAIDLRTEAAGLLPCRPITLAFLCHKYLCWSWKLYTDRCLWCLLMQISKFQGCACVWGPALLSLCELSLRMVELARPSGKFCFVHDVAQRSVRAWENWVHTEWANAMPMHLLFSETLNYHEYWYITGFYYFKGILFLWRCKTGMRSFFTECWPLISRNSCP